VRRFSDRPVALARRSSRIAAAGGIATLATLMAAVGIARSAELVGYQANFESPATLDAIDPDSGATATPAPYQGCFAGSALFFEAGSSGFVSGLASIGQVLYALEWSAASDIFLSRVSADEFGCARLAPVAESPVGFSGLESLAYCEIDGMLYSATFDSSVFPHRGQLVRIDPGTGLGIRVDPKAFLPDDHNVTGMDCDATGTLHAVTGGFAAVSSRYLTIARTSGAGITLGPTGADFGELQSLAIDRRAAGAMGIAGSSLLAAGSVLHQIDPASAAATPIPGSSFDTVWGLAFPLPEPGLDLLGLTGLLSLAWMNRRSLRGAPAH